MAGGVRSPQAVDGDATDVLAALGPDVVVLVADAGLGTINAVRLSMDALAHGGRTAAGAPGGGPRPVRRPTTTSTAATVRWLAERDGYRVVALPGEEAALADAGRRGRGRPTA